MAIFLPKGSLITADSVVLSDHNRSAARLNWEPLKTDERTIAGYLKRQVTASKRVLAVTWDMLPALDSQTVDEKAGRNSLKTLVDSWAAKQDSITISWYELDTNNLQTLVSMEAFLDSYQESLVKRFTRQFWNISIGFIEK